MNPKPLTAITCITLCLLTAFGPATAGNLTISWEPSTGATSYRVHYGTSPGQYSFAVDVGDVTETSINGLDNCTMWYFAATAHGPGGASGFSNEDSSWPRPVVSAVSPASAEQGSTLDLLLSGSNLQTGSTVRISAANVVVNSVTPRSCGEMTVNVTIPDAATAGPAAIEVTNPTSVIGSAAGLFTITPKAPPVVVAVSPDDGATEVGSGVKPTIRFSEPVAAGTINASTVLLLDETGNAVSQGPGSPRLSADGLVATITPLSELEQGATFRVRVIGGVAGVRDLAGNNMTSTHTQAVGFEVTGASEVPAAPQDLILSLLR